MMKRLSTLIMMNSDPEEYVITDEMRDLIIRYMEACNDGRHSEAEKLLFEIKQHNNHESDD